MLFRANPTVTSLAPVTDRLRRGTTEESPAAPLRLGRRSALRLGFAAGSALAPTALFSREVLAAHPPAIPVPTTAFLPGDPSIERYRQKWALSCELAAAHTALRLVGHTVSEDVMRSTLGRGEDPDETFRGEIQANQTLVNYGVHARGIARMVDLLKGQGLLPAQVSTQLIYSLDDVRVALAHGQPVVAWLPLDLRPSSRVPTRLSSGKIVNLVYAEHAVTLRGYDASHFFVLDPYAGTTPVYEANAMWRAMSLFDDPALAIVPMPAPTAPPAPPTPPPAPPPPPPTSEYFPETDLTLEGGFYRIYVDLGGRQALGVPVTEELTELDALTGEPKQVVYTESARLEWSPRSGAFGLGFAGQELLGPAASPDPARLSSGAIGQHFTRNGGLTRFGFPVSTEVPVPPDSELLPWPIYDAVAQWFQTGILIWDRYGREVVMGRAGLALAQRRGFVSGGGAEVAGAQTSTPADHPPEEENER